MTRSTWLSEPIQILSYRLILISTFSRIAAPFINVQSLLPWVPLSPTLSYQPAFFVNVTQPDGVTPVCAADTPYNDAMVANGKMCAQSCVMTPYCNEFNFMSDTNRCQLFTKKPVMLWPSTDGCVHYQMLDPDNRDCGDIWADGATQDGVYVVYQGDPLTPMTIYCSQGWTVFQNRSDGSQDFNLGWIDYTQGFGNWTREFWMGNEDMYTILSTPGRNYSLLFDMVDFSNNLKYALYDGVKMTHDCYRLSLTAYNSSSTVFGDAFTDGSSNGECFSTTDANGYANTMISAVNPIPQINNCAQQYGGGWWFPYTNNYYCGLTNLNGNRLTSSQNGVSGMTWGQWTSVPNFFPNLAKSDIKVRA